MNGNFEFKGKKYEYSLQDDQMTFWTPLEEKDSWFRFAKKNEYKFNLRIIGNNSEGNLVGIFVTQLISISTDKTKALYSGEIKVRVKAVITFDNDIEEMNINKIKLSLDTPLNDSNVMCHDNELLDQWSYLMQNRTFIYHSKSYMCWDTVYQSIGLILDTLIFVGQKDSIGYIKVDFYNCEDFVGSLSNCKMIDKHVKEDSNQYLITILDILKNDSIQNVIKVMERKRIYMANVDSDVMPQTVKIGWFLNVMAAFEWECREYNFTNVISQEAITAKEEIISAIDLLIGKYPGKVKKHLKSYKKIIGNIDVNISQKLNSFFLDLNEKGFFEPLVHELYSELFSDFSKVEDIACRLQKQRNNFAHGNIDQEIDSIIILDIFLLRKLIFISQLDKCEVMHTDIEKCYEVIFRSNPFKYYRSMNDGLKNLESYLKSMSSNVMS